MTQIVQLSEIADQIRGVAYGKDDVIDRPTEGYVPVLRANNIQDDDLKFEDLVYVKSGKVSDKQLIKTGDIVIAASSGSISIVGKAAQSNSDLGAGFGAFCKVVRPRKAVFNRYLGHFFRTPAYRQKMSKLAEGANINNLKNEHIDNLKIPLPPLEEQKRIAAILDQADEIRCKRKHAIDRLNQLGQAIFHEMFGDLIQNEKDWPQIGTLGDFAEIASGITKGRDAKSQATRSVPYLAVVNVQDKRLKLDPLKEIEATESEIDRYKLLAGDLLLTEGGDPDKLGRGTLWGNEISECIHQNHVFRVRVSSPIIEPLFLNWFVGSAYGKKYFLRSAKQTTGIASINMTQLKALPMLVPPLELQKSFSNKLADLQKITQIHDTGTVETERLFASLQHRAFAGEL